MADNFGRRLTDNGQITDPMMLLGQLHARVGNLEDTMNTTARTIGQVANDITDMKMLHASERGRDKAFALIVKAFHVALVICTAIGTAYATVKNIEVPHVPR